MTGKYLCWTDTESRRFFSPVDTCSVSIPGRKRYSYVDDVSDNHGDIIQISSAAATVYFSESTDYVKFDIQSVSAGDLVSTTPFPISYGFSDTSPGSIFLVSNIKEALDWVKTGDNKNAIY